MLSEHPEDIPIRNAAAPSTLSIVEVQARCEDLNSQLVQEIEEKIQFKGQFVAAQKEHRKEIKQVENEHAKEIRQLRENHIKEKTELEEDLDAFRAESGFTQDLRRRHKALEKEHADLQDKYQVLASIPPTPPPHTNLQKSTEDELRAKIAALELTLEIQKPLYEVGVQVRLRFLEQARETVQYKPRWQLSNTLIEAGNSAAHNGNGAADASLLASDSVPEAKKILFNKVFKDAYKHAPEERSSVPKLLLEARDCEATILTLKSLNEGLNRPLLQRQRALENVEVMEVKAGKLTKEEFDVDTDMIRRLTLVKEFTTEIVEYDRRTGGGVKKPDTSYGASISEDPKEEMGGSLRGGKFGSGKRRGKRPGG